MAKRKSMFFEAKYTLNDMIWCKTGIKIENILQGTTSAQR